MNCPSCKRELSEGSTVCEFCGTVIAQPKANETTGFNAEELLGKAKQAATHAQEVYHSDGVQRVLGWLKTRLGITEDCDTANAYERGKSIVPDCVVANNDEKPVKQYNIARLRTRMKFMKAEGRLQITSKRVLFRAAGMSLMGPTTLQHEFAIEEIAGIEIRKDYRLSALNLCVAFLLSLALNAASTAFAARLMWAGNAKTVGVLLALVGIALLIPFFLLKRHMVIKACSCAFSMSFLIASAGVFKENGFIGFCTILSSVLFLVSIFLVAFRRNLVIDIKTKSASDAIQIRRKNMGLFSVTQKSEYTGYKEVLPWLDTDLAIGEIGAIISDIQKLGEVGIQKWRAETVDSKKVVYDDE